MLPASTDALIREGRDAYRRGESERAVRAFEQAVEERPSGEAFEGLAKARHLAFDHVAAMAAYEQAYAAFRQEGNRLAAARAARTLAWFRGSLYGEWAVYRGWLGRALSLLSQAGEGDNEHGWIQVAQAQRGSDLADQRRRYLAAIDTARRCGDADLECEALVSLGIMLVFSGLAADGMAYLDEALAAVCAGEVDEIAVVEGTFCGLFHVCERTNDVQRAAEWLRAADDLVQRRKFAAVGGYCRAYYGGILTAAGRWAEADRELTAAAQTFSAEHVAIRGSVLCRLAGLRLCQGRIEEAAQLLVGVEQHEDAVRPRAALYLAQGEFGRAQDLLERTLAAGRMEDAVEGPLLALLVDAHLATGAHAEASQASDRLSDLARNQSGLYLNGLAALARGKVCIATGAGDARTCLHEALRAFAHAQLPVDLARTQLELAKALSPSNPTVAIAEATAALEVFERLRASCDVDAATALLRTLGVTTRGGPRRLSVLSRRETDVLHLLGHGLTNAEIGQRLFISPKTVEHHVGRILTKLGLRSRAQAAAHALRVPGSESGAE